MSNELVKTALADRSSVKPLQSVLVSCRHRIGCHMMPPLAARHLRHVPPLSCLLVASYSPRSSVSSLAPPCVSYLGSLSACPSRRSPRFISSAHLILPAIATPARLALLLLPVPRVGGRGVPLLAFISSCVLLVVGIRLRMSSPRSCVPLLSRRLCLVSFHRPASSCRLAGRYRTIGPVRFFLVGFLRGRVLFSACLCYNLCRGDGDLRIGAFVPRSHMPHLL